jgi:hypothetical protein
MQPYALQHIKDALFRKYYTMFIRIRGFKSTQMFSNILFSNEGVRDILIALWIWI